jgi:hypothetical protein
MQEHVFTRSGSIRLYCDLLDHFTMTEAFILGLMYELLVTKPCIALNNRHWIVWNNKELYEKFNVPKRSWFRSLQHLIDMKVVIKHTEDGLIYYRINFEHDYIERLDLRIDLSKKVLTKGIDFWEGDINNLMDELKEWRKNDNLSADLREILINLLLIEQFEFYNLKNLFGNVAPEKIYNSVKRYLKTRLAVDISDPNTSLVDESLKEYDLFYSKLCLIFGDLQPRPDKVLHRDKFEKQFAAYKMLKQAAEMTTDETKFIHKFFDRVSRSDKTKPSDVLQTRYIDKTLNYMKRDIH